MNIDRLVTCASLGPYMWIEAREKPGRGGAKVKVRTKRAHESWNAFLLHLAP